MNKSPLHNQNAHASLIWVIILLLLLIQLPRAFSQTAEIQLAALDAAVDNIKPIARCINGTGLQLDENDHTAVLWAGDVNQFSVDNRSVADFRLSLSSGRTDKAPSFDHLIFTKAHVGKQAVDLWVSDQDGNWDMCTTYIYIYESQERTAVNAKPSGISVQVVGNNTNTAASTSRLYQNSPNPFKAQTAISFYQAQNDPVHLQIFDASGRTIKTFQGPFQTGYNEIILSENDLDQQQVLYYQLNSSSGIQTRKMIRVE